MTSDKTPDQPTLPVEDEVIAKVRELVPMLASMKPAANHLPVYSRPVYEHEYALEQLQRMGPDIARTLLQRLSAPNEEMVAKLKPVIANARLTFIRETTPLPSGRRQYTADLDEAIASDVVAALSSLMPGEASNER